MIPTKIFSVVAFFGAMFLSLTAATSLPCYKCPQEVKVLTDDEDVPFDLYDEDQSQGVLECL